MRSLAVLVVVLSATSARADEPPDAGVPPAAPAITDRGSLALGWDILAYAVDSSAGLGTVEGTYRLAPGDGISLHGLFGAGNHTDGGSDLRGTLAQARFGLQIDSCSGGHGFCGFVGLDAAYQWSSEKSLDTGMTTDTSKKLGFVRVGFDAGNSYLRYQMAFEVTDGAIGLQFALAHRFY